MVLVLSCPWLLGHKLQLSNAAFTTSTQGWSTSAMLMRGEAKRLDPPCGRNTALMSQARAVGLEIRKCILRNPQAPSRLHVSQCMGLEFIQVELLWGLHDGSIHTLSKLHQSRVPQHLRRMVLGRNFLGGWSCPPHTF